MQLCEYGLRRNIEFNTIATTARSIAAKLSVPARVGPNAPNAAGKAAKERVSSFAWRSGPPPMHALPNDLVVRMGIHGRWLRGHGAQHLFGSR